jgi:hypothetical protein
MTLRHAAFATLLSACALGFAGSRAAAQTPDLPPDHPPVQTQSPQSLAAEGVRTSGNIARGAADICHIDHAKIERFKTAARKNFTAAPDFDAEWKLGYTEAQSTVDRLAKLKTSDPAEYAKEIGEACPALVRGIDEVTR